MDAESALGAKEPASAAAAEPAAIADHDLLRAYVAGDHAAFASLYDRHELALFRFLRRSVADQQVAEDLLQETWLSVIRVAASYEPRAAFRTWLFRIARSKLVDHWRGREPATVLSLEAPAANDPELLLGATIAADAALQPEPQVLGRAQAAAFVAAVEALPAAQREAFLLHAEGDLGVADIAAVTGVGVETAKSRLRYAVAKLRSVREAWS